MRTGTWDALVSGWTSHGGDGYGGGGESGIGGSDDGNDVGENAIRRW